MQKKLYQWMVFRCSFYYTIKPFLIGYSQKDQKIGFQDQLSPNTGQKVMQNAPNGTFCNNFDLH